MESIRKGSEHLAVLSAYLILTLAMTYPVGLSLSSAIPMDHQIKGWYPGDGDPWHYLWAFWLFKRGLSMWPPQLLWTDLIYYPIGFEMPFLPGIGVILLLAGVLQSFFNLTQIYNLLWLLSFVLSGYAMYLLGRHLFQDRAIAFLAGCLFAFSSYRMVHATEHLPIIMASPFIPLFVLAVIKASQDLTTRYCVLAAVSLAMTAGISWYATISLLIFLVLFVLYHIRRWPLTRLRAGHLRSLSIALVALILTASPFVLPLMLSPSREAVVNQPLSDSNWFAPDLLALFIPGPRSTFFGQLVSPLYERFTGNVYEQTVFVGYIALGFAFLGIFLTVRAKIGFFLTSALAFFLLTLGPLLHVNGRYQFEVEGVTLTIPMPYLLLHYIPFVKGARVSSRFSEMLILSLIVLAGYGLSSIFFRLRSLAWKRVLVSALFIAISVESASVPFPVVETAVPSVYAEMARAPEPFSVLEVPLDWRIIKYHYYQAVHGKPLLTGQPVRLREKYVTYPPDLPLVPLLKHPQLLLQHPIPPDASRAAEQLVAFFRIRYLVIHREYLDPAVFERLDSFIREHFPHMGRRVDHDVVVYALSPPKSDKRLWPESYFIDFGGSHREFVLLSGWSHDERWGEETIQWSNDRESSLYLYLDEQKDRVLEMRVLPFTYQASPPQSISVYLNGAFQEELRLKEGWHMEQVKLPASLFVKGLNNLTFKYRYTARPAQVAPGSADTRSLAVAFDEVRLSPDR
jgi:hypothetical protein